MRKDIFCIFNSSKQNHETAVSFGGTSALSGANVLFTSAMTLYIPFFFV